MMTWSITDCTLADNATLLKPQGLTNTTTRIPAAANASIGSALVAADSASDGQVLMSLLTATKMLLEHSVLFGGHSTTEFE